MTMLQRYKELRTTQKALNSKLLNFIPSGAKGRALILSAAKEIGYRVRGHSIEFASTVDSDRLHEFVLCEPDARGETWLQRFRKVSPDLSPDELALIDAVEASETSLYAVESVNQIEKSLRVRDIRKNLPPCRLVDLGMSQTMPVGAITFGRILTVDDIRFWSGCVVAFCADQADMLLNEFRKLDKVGNVWLRSRKRFALALELEQYSDIHVLYE